MRPYAFVGYNFERIRLYLDTHFTRWKDMKQLPGESVAMYNYRLQQLVTKMTEMPTADRPTERSIYTTFVSGLKPRLRATVQVQCSHFDYDAAVSKAELLEETIRQTEEDEYELSESPPPRPLRRERAEARDELGFKFGGRYQDTYADERQWGGGKRFRPNQPRGNGRPTYATPKVESNRELQLLRQGARGRGLGQARSRPQAVFQTAPGKANAGRENHYGPTSGAKRKAGEPGCRHEICFPFLKDGRCRFGDECERVHVPTLDARQDVRRHVKTSIDEPMRQAARDWLKNRDTSRPPNNKPSGPMTTVATQAVCADARPPRSLEPAWICSPSLHARDKQLYSLQRRRLHDLEGRRQQRLRLLAGPG